MNFKPLWNKLKGKILAFLNRITRRHEPEQTITLQELKKLPCCSVEVGSKYFPEKLNRKQVELIEKGESNVAFFWVVKDKNTICLCEANVI